MRRLRFWILILLVSALAPVVLADDAPTAYADVTIRHTQQQGFDIDTSYDSGTNTHYVRVGGGKAGAIFKWVGGFAPQLTQSAAGGYIDLKVVQPNGIGNCCIIAYNKYIDDFDFACSGTCSDCGCMLCFGWPTCLDVGSSVTFGPGPF